MPEIRADRSTALTPLAAPRAVFEGRVARAHGDGDPLVYTSGPEYRTIAELQCIVDQLVGLTVTAYHPDGLLAHGAQARVVGTITAARLDGEFAVATIEISDLSVVEEIRQGLHELSLGYSCNIDENRYQKDTRVDHLSFVPRARCGADCAVRVDATIEVPTPESAPKSDGHGSCTCKSHAIVYASEDSMPTEPETIVMDELKKQLAAALADAAEQTARADAATTRATEAETRATAAEVSAENARRDQAAAVVAAEQARTDAATEIEKIRVDAAAQRLVDVAARVRLLTEANRVLGETEDRSAMADRDIKVAVIKHVDGDDVEAAKPDLYVDGIYDGALRRHAKGSGSRADALVAINNMRQDGAAAAAVASDPMAREKAAQAALKRSMSTAWMKTPQE